MEKDIKTKQKKIIKRSYLARDFDDFKLNLIQHARTFFPNNVEDFTETGLGGMFVDMISYVGDSMSFYLDHQFNELSWRDAIEIDNVKKHIDLAGVKSYGASPSVGYVDIAIRVPISDEIESAETGKRIIGDCLPIIKSGTRFASSNGIVFNLVDDLDFNETEVSSNKPLWLSTGGDRNFEDVASQTPVPNSTGYKLIKRRGYCVSGEIKTESFTIGDVFNPFMELTLEEQNISLIDSIKDSDGNVYYEVDNLSQDNVFSIRDNKKISTNSVEKSISLIGAPYRYTKSFDPQTFITTLTFGGGDATALDDDILPDPADLSIPLYGKKVFSRFALDPNSLMKTNTLGVAPRNVDVSVKYRYGGGFSHNVTPQSVNQIDFLDISFPSSAGFEASVFVRTNIGVSNASSFAGGSPAPNLEELREQIPTARNSQLRVVTKEDLLSRIYSLPSGLGRVFRASISESANSLGQIEIALISRDFRGHLIKNYSSRDDNNLAVAGDNLKINLKNYLESFRLLNDSYIITDAKIHNIGVDIRVIGTPGHQKSLVAQNIILNIKNILDVRKFQINQPIALGDLSYAILSAEGVSSIASSIGPPHHSGVKLLSLHGTMSYGDGIEEYEYSNSTKIIISEYTERGFLFPHKNGIFELKFPENDIRVTVL